MRLNVLILFTLFWIPSALAQNTSVHRDVTATVPPTQWAVSINSPPCNLQVYIGRVNTTRDSSSCAQMCVNQSGLPSGSKIQSLQLSSREEHSAWQDGAVGWSAWEHVDKKHGCAVFKNWSHNRFREARIVATFEATK